MPKQKKPFTHTDINRLLYFADLICKKIDLQTNAFIKRFESLREGNLEKAEFIENMMLKPLDGQIAYLARKAACLAEGGN